MTLRFQSVHKFSPFHDFRREEVEAGLRLPGIRGRVTCYLLPDREHPGILQADVFLAQDDSSEQRSPIEDIKATVATPQASLIERLKTGTLREPINIKLWERGRDLDPADSPFHISVQVSKLTPGTDDYGQPKVFPSLPRTVEPIDESFYELKPADLTQYGPLVQEFKADLKTMLDRWFFQQRPEYQVPERGWSIKQDAERAWYHSDSDEPLSVFIEQERQKHIAQTGLTSSPDEPIEAFQERLNRYIQEYYGHSDLN